MNQYPQGGLKRLFNLASRYISLQLDYAKLTAVEKLTVLLSTVAFFGLLIIVGFIALVFVSIGVGHLLSTTIAPHAAYLFVSAFYALLLIALIVFRNQLIFNPAARFISKLLLKSPDDNEK